MRNEEADERRERVSEASSQINFVIDKTYYAR